MNRCDDAFATSYLSADQYPQNLIQRATNALPSSLEASRSTLDKAEKALFVTEPLHVELPIRDLATSDGKELDKYNIHKPDQLRRWLGIETRPDPTNAARTLLFSTKKDPKCRFVYIYGEDSRSPLKLHREMLTLLLTHHQVMPAYLDFMLVFGNHKEARDTRFSGFRDQTTISDPPRYSAPHLGRSGRQFQLCYNLKNVAQKSEHPNDIALDEWYIRQAAVHHQFDVIEGTSLWIVTKGNRDIQERFKEMTARTGRPEDRNFATTRDSFNSSLSVHLMMCYWSTEGWRWHIRWLETLIERKTAIAALGPRSEGHNVQTYSPDDVMALHRWEDKIGEAVMALESNIEILSLLQRYYLKLLENKDFPLRVSCFSDVKNFADRVDDNIQNFKMQVARAKTLIKNTKDRKELIILHLQTDASQRMEKVSFRMEKEAIVVRVVTIVTLVYLPATFVSTFFSTDIIKYQNPDGPPDQGTYSPVAMMRWLQVTIPLTLLTLFLAWSSLWWESLKRAGDRFRTLPASQRTQTFEMTPTITKRETSSIV